MPRAQPEPPNPTQRAGTSKRTNRARQDENRELDHRLANSLQLAADFLIFEHTRVTDPQARAALIETAERLSAVGQMHRFLAAQSQALSGTAGSYMPAAVFVRPRT